MDHDGHPLAITAADAVAANGVPPWNWRETPGNGKICKGLVSPHFFFGLIAFLFCYRFFLFGQVGKVSHVEGLYQSNGAIIQDE